MTDETTGYSAEQAARDMLARAGVEDAQRFTAGDLVEIANIIAALRFTSEEVETMRQLAEDANRGVIDWATWCPSWDADGNETMGLNTEGRCIVSIAAKIAALDQSRRGPS
jgi:hypothetical protein